MAKKIISWSSGLISVCLLSLVIISPAFSEAEIGIAAFNDGSSLPTKEQISNFETELGKTISTVNWFMGFDGDDSNGNIDQPFPLDSLIKVRDHDGYNTGIVPMLTWEPWNLEKINNGDLNVYIKDFASKMKEYDAPIRLRFGHEMIQDDNPATAGWYPWQDRSDEYKAVFQKVHDIFHNSIADGGVGATNVEFVWSPNSNPSDVGTLTKYYPGEEYVDWLGIDGYNFGNLGATEDTNPGQYFGDIFVNIYDSFTSAAGVSVFGDKPIMLAEIASSEHTGLPKDAPNDGTFDKAKWIEDAFKTVSGGLSTSGYTDQYFDKIKAFYWFNIDNRPTKEQADFALGTDNSAKFGDLFIDDGNGKVLFQNNFETLVNNDLALSDDIKLALLALWQGYRFGRDWRLNSSPESWGAFKTAMQDPYFTGHAVVPEPVS